jgi:pimeloyl-ACP methyl ester carboxylesterase
MKLEVISKYPRERTHPTPLVFLHGAWHAAWCWENVLPYVVNQGYEVHALSLRGHGNSEGREGVRWFSTRGYVDDLQQVIEGLPTPPVVIAHSMGGYVLQKYLETHNLPAGVLIATVPTSGILGMFLRWTGRHPVSILKTFLFLNPWYMVSTPAEAKDVFFSDDYPDDQFVKYYAHIQGEAFLAALDMSLLSPLHPKRVKTPLLVIGAENDRIFTVAEQQKTARTYNSEATIYPHTAHDMMLEPAWQAVTDQILNWLHSRNL